MIRGWDTNALRILFWTGAGACCVLALPAACFYPDYTFDQTATSVGSSSSSAGGGGASSSSSASSTSGSQGGGGATTTTTASSGSGTGGSAAEDCLNNKDDDGDNLIDCADSDCNAGYACVPAAPIGWANGYVLLFAGTPGTEPACPPEFPSSSPYKGISGIIGDPATCDPCTCDPPSGATCKPPTTITISNKTCGNLPTVSRPLDPPPNWTGMCHGPSGYLGGDTTCGGPCNVSVSAPAPTVMGGACMPQGGTATVIPVAWTSAGLACGNAPPGGGCAGADVCQPHPPGEPFLTGLCVFKEGDNFCPNGPFTDRHLFYQTAMDTRDCTACSCGAASGLSCTVSITLYSDIGVNMCNTPVATFDAGGCTNISGNPTLIGRSAMIPAPSGGSCPASGGQPTGAVTPVLPTTFCCIP